MQLLPNNRQDVMCFIKDKKGVYVNVNQFFLDCAELAGADEVIGKTDHDLVWKNYATLVLSHDHEVLVVMMNLNRRILIARTVRGTMNPFHTEVTAFKDARSRGYSLHRGRHSSFC